MSGLTGLLKKPKTPVVEDPATMPDEMDEMSIRKARGKASRSTTGGSSRVGSASQNIGREYTRGTLG